jgi:hypothetical protein
MSKSSSPPKQHVFRARLEQRPGGGPFYVAVPAAVSRAAGKRGNVPVVAVVNGRAEFRASLVPSGGGRHILRLNATTRAQAGAELGARVGIELAFDENPTADPMPPDLADALREAGVLEIYRAFPAGKQNHILHWIEKSAREETRAKRIAMAVEVAESARERKADARR